MIAEHLIDFLLKLYALKRVPRIGWLIIGVPKCSVESVSDHSFFVTLMAYLLGFYLRNVDSEKLIKLALLHDLSESIVHDIGGKARELIPRHIRKEAEYIGLRNIIPDDLKAVKKDILALWKEYVEGSSKEAKIIRLLDKLEMMIQALSYMKTLTKNENLHEFFNDIDQIINESDYDIIKDLANSIKSRYIELT